MSFIDDFNDLKIKLKDIQSATNDFSDNPIGNGGFGKVFKGELSLPDGEKKMVAFKRLDRKYGQGDVEFWKEIMMLSQYKHENLISLLGYCDDDGERILVYEYASGGSLDLYLGKTSLTWNQLLTICLGAARGLNHLHDPLDGTTQQRVLHRDVKSANILLDENFTAKISDFGLSKLGPANQQYTYLFSNGVGTHGYCDPMYIETGILSKESDVYSFGVVLFEVMCGRTCFESRGNGQQNILVQKWKKCYEENGINDIISNHLKEQMDVDICFRDSLKMFASIAYRCLNRDRKERPTMAEVVKELVMALDIQDEIKVDMQPNLDTDWEGKLPSDYADIIKLSKDNMQAKTHKELHYLLRSGFLINTKKRSQKFRLRGALSLIFDFLLQDLSFNYGLQLQWKWFSVSKRMKKRHMLPTIVVFKRPFTWNTTTMCGSRKQVSCTWKPFQTKTNFKWKSLPESRFELVAECGKIKEFTIVCELEAELLSLETAYACYLVYKLPTKHSLVSGLIEIDNKTHRGKSNRKLLHVDLLTPIHIPFIRHGVDEPHDIPIRTRKIKGHPKLRKDGWLEIQIWDFHNDATHEPITMHCHMKSYHQCNLTGLLVQGIEFRPAKVLFASSP